MRRLRASARRRRSAEEGQVLVLFTISIVVMMVFASIVIDLGLLRNNRQTLASAVDASALAGGTLMPVNGCTDPQSSTSACASVNGAAATAVSNLIGSTMRAGYPGISASDYTITYRCLIGIDTSTPPQPYISRDIPEVCNPRNALGHTPVASDFQGAGSVRFSICNPSLGDKCNVVVVSGATTTNYAFGRVVGVNQGWSGTIMSAACNGPCGQPPNAPVDLVVLIDRTASMSTADVQATRDAANAILGVYDPTIQRVALGFLGLSSTSATCSGPSGPSVAVTAMQPATPVAPVTGTGTAWVQTSLGSTGGATTLTISKPTGTATGQLLVAGITVAGGTGETVTPPAGWTLIQRTNNAAVLSVLTYSKVTGGAEPASYVWTFAPTNKATGGIVRYTGIDTAHPVDVSSTNNSGATSNAAVIGSTITTTGQQEVVLGVFGTTARTTFTPPAGMTEAFDLQNGTAANAGPTVELAAVTQATIGATGSKTATAAANGRWGAQLVAINPAPVDTYGTSYPADLAKWIPIGFTGTDGGTPSAAYNEAYSNGTGTVYGTTHIGSAIACFDHPGGTGTNLTTPVQMAAQYLQAYGRPNVTWGILLETDGQPSYSSTGDPGNYTCQSAVTAATAAKAITNAAGAHIQLFTVGFGLDGANDVNCPDGSGTYSGKNATKALADMATDDLAPQPDGVNSGCVPAENTDFDHFFCEPKTSDLTSVFQTVATTLSGARTHLVQLNPPPSIYSISPTSGTHTGGTTVMLTGKYFTGSTSVTFGGISASFTVLSDTSIRVTSPAGTTGNTVHIVVTNPGGSSPPVSGDRYTYT